MTVQCSEPQCDNTVTVTPHGTSTISPSLRSASPPSDHVENPAIYVKARCKECEPKVIVFDLWGTAGVDEDEERENGEEVEGEWGATGWEEGEHGNGNMEW
ncbi:hypothetical protein PTT_07512 [Pyrenophora teres f. teres 0-1]|uniref:Uncharacterized protein n=1 Tax=Pyrenophora teres f. teres (strain 0-1) TaxID=861557 RepID=E3RHT9_PYRTT|nr:hypothetical protein PTT_07512 [Pyrenophora teres f. teres 0-1]